ncbi:hypothetical protein KXW68_004963 [Aspergillus fumigatus]|nr:hypothetical protein KXW68_004963 [Aspergillus fumigatus]
MRLYQVLPASPATDGFNIKHIKLRNKSGKGNVRVKTEDADDHEHDDYNNATGALRDERARNQELSLVQSVQYIIQCWIDAQRELIASIRDPKPWDPACRNKDFLTFNTVKSTVCEDQAQEKNVGTKDKRRIEDDLREN